MREISKIKILQTNLFCDGSTKHAAKVAREGLNYNFILLMSKRVTYD